MEITFQNCDVAVESPGRINLIGEHLDYNGGHVLPAAIHLKVKLYLNRNDSSLCTIYSKNFDARFTVDLNKVEVSQTEWHNYFLGVVHYIERLHPGRIKGFDCTLESDLPIGSGVSSSAALECGIAKGLDELFKIGLSDDDIIAIAQNAEHNFVGTKCGVMDQFTVVRGKKGKLINLNCYDLSFEYVPADLEPYEIVLVNTNVSHNLATSEYNLRRDECENGFRIVQKKHPEYKALASVPEEVIREFKFELSPSTFNKLMYVVQENTRTLEAISALKKGNIMGLGRELFASHEGLQHLYEVSCEELDFLIDFANEFEAVIGARMMGGGFGGCTINLVHKNAVDTFERGIKKAYFEKFKIKASSFTVTIGDGVKVSKA